MVIIHHVEQIKSKLYISNIWENKVIVLIGQLGVVLFFVLSGFLISYLLFQEQKVTGTIDIKAFYTRRMLRIWPLYFVIVILALFILPHFNFFTITGYGRDVIWSNLWLKIVLFISFLPNLVLVLYGVIPYASQTWSIGAEEQFYLLWPILNKRITNKITLLVGVVLLYLIVKVIIRNLPGDDAYRNVLYNFWNSTPIDCMAIGGFFSLLIFDKSVHIVAVRQIIFKKWIQFIVFLVTVYTISIGFHFPYVNNEFYSVLFGILICNFAGNKQRLFSMECGLLDFLGKISYGLYLFHPIVIVFSINTLRKAGHVDNYILYPMAFGLTVLLSAASYFFYEKRFIDKKIRYSKLISGNLVNSNKIITYKDDN